MVAHACYPSIWEVEAEGLEVNGQIQNTHGIQSQSDSSEALFQKVRQTACVIARQVEALTCRPDNRSLISLDSTRWQQRTDSHL